jgi:hypothetical protein
MSHKFFLRGEFVGLNIADCFLNHVMLFVQNEQLYVFDPLALHHIFVKQQYNFELTEVFVV